ncbi:hypothetical protein EGR_05205 [Echinococcus granulosus]|uniref:Uncharacterized protein n=1 Tax=Echinococcus granulosus TaxID=6210 RepID=W6V1V8_ECHGR|nr:hypothetical protein EGR_05205 [Echinococcus granulosus]EUB59879.1 hypothetical protein EGR_05205 [Echinococcus granulosus]
MSKNETRHYAILQGHIILSELHPSVMLPKEVYQSLIIKSSGSATRLIRLLMKSFFSQEELAASSLSGEGIYKQRLQPEITEAIKGPGSGVPFNLINFHVHIHLSEWKVCLHPWIVAASQPREDFTNVPTSCNI